MKKYFEKYQVLHFIILLLLAYFLLNTAYSFDFLPNVYQARDINYAKQIISGHYVWFGPDLTGGGKLPGSFYYWILSIPLRLSQNFTILLCLQNFLAALAATVFFFSFRLARRSVVSYLAYFLFLNSFVILDNLSLSWNPSYIYIFQALIFYFFSDENRKLKSIYYFLIGIILGLSIQIHYTQLIFLVTIILFTFFNKKQIFYTKIKNIFILMLGMLLPVVPFLAWKLSHSSIVDTFYNSKAGFSTFARVPLKILNDFNEDYKVLLNKFDEIFRMILLGDIFFFGVLIFIAIYFYNKNKLLKANEKLNKFTLIGLAASTPLVFWLFFETDLLRYVVPFFLFFNLVSAQILSLNFTNSNKNLIIFFFLALCVFLFKIDFSFYEFRYLFKLICEDYFNYIFIFILLALLIFIDKNKFTLVCLFVLFTTLNLKLFYINKSEESEKVSAADYAKIFNEVIDETNWNYDEFRTKVYLIHFSNEMDLSLLYEKEFRMNSHKSDQNQISGVIIIKKNDKLINDENANRFDYQNIKDLIPKEFYDAFVEGEIGVTKLSDSRYFQLVFYSRKDHRNVRWNNIGHDYRDDVELSHVEGEDVFTISECNNSDLACVVSFGLTWEKNNFIKLRMWGSPIGVLDSARNPSWTAQIDNPQLIVSCDNKKTSYLIATQIGSGVSSNRINFLAPFERFFKSPCAKPNEVSIKIVSGLSIYNYYTVVNLNKKNIVWYPNVH